MISMVRPNVSEDVLAREVLPDEGGKCAIRDLEEWGDPDAAL